MTEPTHAQADLVPFTGEYAPRVMLWVDSEETYRNLCGEMPYPPNEDLVETWQRPDVTSFLLFANHQPVAYAELWDVAIEKGVEVVHLVVDPARRGRGYGTLMLNLLAERAASRRGVRIAIVNFFHGDETVLGCYLKAGFELVGTQPVGDGLRMERRL